MRAIRRVYLDNKGDFVVSVKKNKEYVLNIEDNGFNGEGIGKIDNFTIFVPKAIKGEVVKVLIIKVTSSYAIGKIIEFIKKSKYRVQDLDCATYKRCGGCNLRHMDYNYTLDLKRDIVINCLNKEKIYGIHVNNTIGMGNPYNYRNKLQYPVGIDKEGKPIMGVYARKSHEIIKNSLCSIQNLNANLIAQDTFKYLLENGIKAYNEENQSGDLRHIVVRNGNISNEVMLVLVLNNKKVSIRKEFIDFITNKYKNIKTIVLNYNLKNTNVIFRKENKIIFGDGYIYDILGNYKFKISPLSFYQVNSVQAEVLYEIAIENANISSNDVVLDLYCGIGTIGIFASKYAKMVYGIEIVEDAIKDANENAKINNIENIKFFCGDVEKILDNTLNEIKDKTNIVFVDKPRKGLDKNTINILNKIKPKKIVYISCNPATFARDVKLLISDSYSLNSVQPVDMFPFTSNVECVAVLELKNYQ